MEKVILEARPTVRVNLGNGKVGNTDWLNEWEIPLPFWNHTKPNGLRISKSYQGQRDGKRAKLLKECCQWPRYNFIDVTSMLCIYTCLSVWSKYITNWINGMLCTRSSLKKHSSYCNANQPQGPLATMQFPLWTKERKMPGNYFQPQKTDLKIVSKDAWTKEMRRSEAMPLTHAAG